jgi:hypothetical protein
MKSLIKPIVHLVTSNVLNVLPLLIIVIFVLKLESKDLNQFVTVNITNMLMLMETVNLVIINVTLVKLLPQIVLLVKISELQLHLVHVQPNGMNSKDKILLNVKNVIQDVLNVKVLKIIV